MATELQSDRRASDMEVYIKQRCGTEFLHAEKNGTHGLLLDIHGDGTVNVSTMEVGLYANILYLL